MRRRLLSVFAVVGPLMALLATGIAPAGAGMHSNWPAYLAGPAHSSYNAADTAITPKNAGSLTQAWSFMPDKVFPGPIIYSSPTVYQGRVYFGANNGYFYVLNESNGTLVWKKFIGYEQGGFGCNSRGFVGTATVIPDPVTGVPTVYVDAGDGYLYAMRASDGSIFWRTPVDVPTPNTDDYFAWSSPTVVNGKIYVGIASSCDNPTVRGGLVEVDQASGAILATYYTVPPGNIGPGVWSSAAVAPGPGGSVFVTTGNSTKGNVVGDASSIVKLDPNSLAKQDIWSIPTAQLTGDADFGASPTLFSATLPGNNFKTLLVGACNKNGVFYALMRNNMASGPVWQFQEGAKNMSNTNSICDAAGVFDDATGQLFLASDATTINGTAYNGSIRSIDPATGNPIWQTGLPGTVLGTPTLDGAGVISVATFDFSGAPNADYLIDASNGNILATLSTNNTAEWAQPVFADNFVLLATAGGGLFAYRA